MYSHGFAFVAGRRSIPAIVGKNHRADCRNAGLLGVLRRLSSSDRPFPVGIFIDLDNVKLMTHSRQDAHDFVSPFRKLGSSLSSNTIVTFRGFGNKATQTFRSEEEMEQEFDQEWDGYIASTGYDENEVLRCGVCGAKMNLNKKEEARGWNPEDKLEKHMRTLHDREQSKRRTWQKSGHTLTKKDIEKSKKYKAAQIGLSRLGIAKGRNGENELFSVLREQGIKCELSSDVDKSLELAASKWMSAHNQNGNGWSGCLVVVSEDADFVPLIKSARKHNFLAVSATPRSTDQTKKLAAVSDFVLRMKGDGALDDEYRSFGRLVLQPTSGEGVNFLIDVAAKGYDEDEAEDYLDEDYMYSDDEDYSDEDDYGDDDDDDTNLRIVEDDQVLSSAEDNRDIASPKSSEQASSAPRSDDINTGPSRTPFERPFKRLPEGQVTPELIQEVANSPWNESGGFEYELFCRLRFLRLIKTEKAGWKMAIILHYAAIGEERPRLEEGQGKSQKRKSRKVLIAELERRGLSTEGLSRVLHTRYAQALMEEQIAFNEELVRSVLVDRGASDMGAKDELNLRLVKSVLNVPVEKYEDATRSHAPSSTAQ